MFSIYILFTVPFLILGYVVFYYNRKKTPQNFYPDNRPLLFGHRGSPTHFTENTIRSFEKAIDQGVDGIEFDIRLSKDKKIIIFHDSSLKRLANVDKEIKTQTFAQLQEHTLINGGKIPRLEDILPLMNKVKVLNIEIKTEGLFRGLRIIKPLIHFIRKHDLNDKCIISSFNPLVLWRLKLKRPKTIIGYLYNRNMLFPEWNNFVCITRVRPDNLHIHYSLLNSWVVRWAKGKGMKINSYTINDKRVYEKVKRQGIDGVFTDNIEYLK